MAEEAGDKTEAPTPRRRAEAREQGNIARSPDLVAAALLIGIMYTLSATGPGLMRALKALMAEVLSLDVLGNSSTHDVFRMCLLMVKEFSQRSTAFSTNIAAVAEAARKAGLEF